MPCAIFRIPMLALAVVAICASGLADDAAIPAKLHPWGQFDPGAWKTVRVETETLNEQGQVVSTSTADTKTTLVDIDNNGVTLEIQACMEVAGKRFEAEPQTVKQGFHGDLAMPNLKLADPVAGQVTIEDQKIHCKVRQLESTGADSKTVTTIYYCLTLSPYILKRESVTTDLEGKNVLSETNMDVISLNMPSEIRQGETRNGAYVMTVHKNGKGTVTTLSLMVLPEVPGGVVFSSSKEVDKTGRLVRRSTLKLVDYNDDPDKDRTGLFGRKRPPRSHRAKPAPHDGRN
jgi:hypothetical protein